MSGSRCHANLDQGAMHRSPQSQSQKHFTSTVSANGMPAVCHLLGTRVPAIRQRQSVRRRVPGGKYDLCVRAGQSSPFQQSHADRPKHELAITPENSPCRVASAESHDTSSLRRRARSSGLPVNARQSARSFSESAEYTPPPARKRYWL